VSDGAESSSSSSASEVVGFPFRPVALPVFDDPWELPGAGEDEVLLVLLDLFEFGYPLLVSEVFGVPLRLFPPLAPYVEPYDDVLF
jgi:hypothetical protein